jgi:hypothetical protein
MIGAPPNAKRPIGFTPCGIDEGGDNVFFGFQVTETETFVIEGHHSNVAALIHYLQAIAHEAGQRRRKNPANEHARAKTTIHNPLHSIQFDIDSTGQHAILRGMTADGLPGVLEIPYLLMVALQQQLPKVIAQMELVQGDHSKQQ